MIAEEYLSGSRAFRRLKDGPHGPLIEPYAARLVEDGLAGHGCWRCLNLVHGLLSWIASRRVDLVDLDERVVERYLRRRGRRQSIQRATVPHSSGGCRCCATKALGRQNMGFDHRVCGGEIRRNCVVVVRHERKESQACRVAT